MNISLVRHILNLFINRGALIDSATSEFSTTRDSASLEVSRNQATKQTRDTWAAISGSFKLIFLTIIFGAISNLFIHHFCSVSPKLDSLLQYFGSFIMIWATLGKAGWTVQTMEGDTLVERVNESLFRALYIIGTFSIVLGMPLE